MTAPFWDRKKVLITGHTGFKGSWLSLWLKVLGAEVLGYALPPTTTPNLFEQAKIDSDIESIIADIRDADRLKQAVQSFKPEIIFHMAAQPLVRYSYHHPIETYATNVMGTAHLFEAVKSTDSVKAIVNVTTDKCYQNKEQLKGYCEDDKLGGYDPYSSSKACAEILSSAYRDSYFRAMNVGLATARAGNVIGGGDWSQDRLIPDIISAFMKQSHVQIRNPHALRPWQHVLEPLGGYLQLAEQLYIAPDQYAEGWNFGPDEGDVKPVSWIADYISQEWADGSGWTHDNSEHPHEATYLTLDCTKAKRRLNWAPQSDLEEGLNKTIAWYKSYISGDNMEDVTLAQIKSFINSNSHEEGLVHVKTTTN